MRVATPSRRYVCLLYAVDEVLCRAARLSSECRATERARDDGARSDARLPARLRLRERTFIRVRRGAASAVRAFDVRRAMFKMPRARTLRAVAYAADAARLCRRLIRASRAPKMFTRRAHDARVFMRHIVDVSAARRAL